MADNVGTLLFKDKQVRLLSVLANKEKELHISDLSREANVTYVHTSKFIKKCEEHGIVSSERHGRIKRLFITEKGKYIANSISDIMEKIKISAKNEQQAQEK